MTGTIIFATVALVAIGAFSILNTVQKFNDEIRSNEYNRRRHEGHTGMPQWR